MIYSYELNGVTLSNLDELNKRQVRLDTQRVCEINDLAFDLAKIFLEMLSEEYGIYEILSYIGEILASYDFFFYDKVSFVKRLLSIIASHGHIIREEDFLQCEHGNEKIAFMKNTLSDEAYDVFSQDLNDPRLIYKDGITSSVSAVVEGEAEYCILPFEEKGGARVLTVGELLFKYDLKINRVTPVFGPLGNADMRYALISKSFTIPEIENDDDRYLEIRLRRDSSFPLSELLLAAEDYKSSIYRVNSLRFTEDDGASEYYSVVFFALGTDFVELLTYLTLFSGAYTPVGIYKNLE